MPLNLELLEKVKAQILAEPENFAMGRWHCGSAYCIAGWVEVIDGRFPQHSKHGNEWSSLGLASGAKTQASIGCTDLEFRNLVHIDYWPTEFYDKYFVGTPQQRVETAVAMIDDWTAKILEKEAEDG